MSDYLYLLDLQLKNLVKNRPKFSDQEITQLQNKVGQLETRANNFVGTVSQNRNNQTGIVAFLKNTIIIKNFYTEPSPNNFISGILVLVPATYYIKIYTSATNVEAVFSSPVTNMGGNIFRIVALAQINLAYRITFYY